jgi:hypothetical protein
MNKNRKLGAVVTESSKKHWNKVDVLPKKYCPTGLKDVTLIRSSERPPTDIELHFVGYENVVLFNSLDYVVKSYAIYDDKDGREYAYTWD